MIFAYASLVEIVLSAALIAVALAIALRGLRRPYPLPPIVHRPPRSAVTLHGPRPFDWRIDDPELAGPTLSS